MSKKKWSIIIVGIAALALSAGLISGIFSGASSVDDLIELDRFDILHLNEKVVSNDTHTMVYIKVSLHIGLNKPMENGSVTYSIFNQNPDTLQWYTEAEPIHNIIVVVKVLSNETKQGFIEKNYYVADYLIPLHTQPDRQFQSRCYWDVTEIINTHWDAKAYGWKLETVVEN